VSETFGRPLHVTQLGIASMQDFRPQPAEETSYGSLPLKSPPSPGDRPDGSASVLAGADEVIE
jgi:hypothetical protein